MKARQKAISKFQQADNSRILVASLKAGGVGLNLTTATRAILVDLYWNAAIEQQGKLN
jgi:SNF2 family DNA or RNA helicase